MKYKKPPVDRAAAMIKKATNTDILKVSVTRSISLAAQQSPDWGSAKDIQTAVVVWNGGADAIETNAKVITDLREKVKTAEAKQNGLRRDWVAARGQVVSSVTVFCGGSADKVKAFAFDVRTRSKLGALSAPSELTVNPGTGVGEAAVLWMKGLATHGFIVQHATDPSNPATLSTPMPSTKPKLTLDGLPSKANVSVRVAAIDPASSTGQSPWSAWVVGNAL